MSYFRNLIQKINPFQTRAFYSGAKKSSANKDFWNANTPFEQTAISERDTLRARARWLSANNPIMGNIDNSFITNVVGKGISLQARTADKALNDEIESRFKAWCRRCDITERLHFFDVQKMVYLNRMVDGEIFIYKKIVKGELKLQILEADAIDGTEGENGLTLDVNGKVTHYNFLDKNQNKIKIKSELVINFCKLERPTQYRGVSEYKRAILDIKNFSAYQSSTVLNARANAEIAYTIETERSNEMFGATPQDGSDEELHDINGLMVYYLKAGEKINKHSNSFGAGYDDFITSTVRMIASARCISYELAFKDYSKVNFASSRASIIQDNKKFDDEQIHIATYLLDDIYRAWLEVEVLKTGIIAPVKFEAEKSTYLKCNWAFPRRVWVDPKKELDAIEKEIKLNLTTETDICSQMGLEYEDILKTKQKENELKKSYGILSDFDEEILIKKASQYNKQESSNDDIEEVEDAKTTD